MKRFRKPSVVMVIAMVIAFAFVGQAIAAMTVTMKSKWESLDRNGNTWIFTISSIAWDSSYPTGGEPVTASDFGATYRIKAMWKIFDTYKVSYNFDEANQKFMILYSDYSNGTDGPFVELPNGYDPSSETTTVMSVGW